MTGAGGKGNKGGEGLRRRRRGPSLLGSVGDQPGEEPAPSEAGPGPAPAAAGDGADASAVAPTTLSRAERRRRKQAASDQGRDLSARQRKLLGVPEQAFEPPAPARPASPEPQRPAAFVQHDALVVVLALGLFAVGFLAHARLTAPVLEPFSRHGLSLERPSGWLAPTVIPPPPLRLAADAPLENGAPGGVPPYHVLLASPLDPLVAIEIRIQPRGDHDQPRLALALARAARYGEAYWAAEGDSETIAGHDWVRSRFRYATKVGRSAPPSLATGIEYAAVNDELIYVVTFHGSEHAARELAELLAPTLTLAAPTEAR